MHETQQRIHDLEQALKRERDRAAALERRCDSLETARSVTARLLTSGSRPTVAEQTVRPSAPESHPWLGPACSRRVDS